MTLQVILVGSDGVVIASDTCVERVDRERRRWYRITESSRKIIILPRLAYMFAGDDCAKEIGAVVAKQIIETPKPLPYDFIEKAANEALEPYTKNPAFRDDYRKIIWVQAEGDKGDKFSVWPISCDRGDKQFVSWTCDSDGRCCACAGDEFNPARFIVDYYYKKYPKPRTVSNLKKMAAHMIVTGREFNSGSVCGLEMAVGYNGGFTPVPQEDIQTLIKQSQDLHIINDAYFSKD